MASSLLCRATRDAGALRNRYVAPDSGAHVLGDLTIGANGALFVSEGLGSGVYMLAPGHSTLKALPPGVLVFPQTPALSSDGATLCVSDYTAGIAAVEVDTGTISWLTHTDSLALTGVDGLCRAPMTER